MFRRRVHLSFFFNDTAPTEIYTLSLHDALPISNSPGEVEVALDRRAEDTGVAGRVRDRKSTRLNSRHVSISYAVVGLKKKKRLQAGRSGVSRFECGMLCRYRVDF